MQTGPGSLKDSVHEFKDKAVHHAQEARDRVLHAGRQVDDEAHRSPWIFVGVAAFFSMILGYLLGRTSRRD